MDKNTQDPSFVYIKFGRSYVPRYKRKSQLFSPSDLHPICITENLVKQWKRTYPNPSSLLPLSSSLKLKKSFLKVASCVVLLIIPATKAQSLAHRCQ